MVFIYFDLIIKLLLGFLIIIFYLNYTGKTQVSQMNAIDLIGNFILGGIIGGVIYNPDITMLQYLSSLFIGIAIIGCLNFLVKRTSFFRSFALGKPIRIVDNGKFCLDTLRDKNNKLDIYNIACSLRILGYDSFSNVKFVQVEPNGQLSVRENKKDTSLPGSLVYANQILDLDYLKSLDKDQNWLLSKLKELDIADLDQVYFIELYNHQINVIDQKGNLLQTTF
ncbi:DUF421 domain-containing protein [Myroides sp. LJL119]